MLTCATGKHLTSVTLDARASRGEVPINYLRVKLEKIVTTSYQVAPGEQDGWPLDVVRMDYLKITTTYTPQNPNGSPGTPVTVGFDFETNKAL